MFKRKGQRQEQVKNVKRPATTPVKVKGSGYIPDASQRYPFNSGNRNS